MGGVAIRPADIILVNGAGLISDTIERITRSPYSHVAGVVNDSQIVEAQSFRKTGYAALSSYQGADVYTCDELTDEQRAKIVTNVSRQIGRRYSYVLIAWELIRYTVGVMLVPTFDWEPIICSTLWINEGYRRSGIDPCPGIKYPTPGDIALSPLFRKVGES